MEVWQINHIKKNLPLLLKCVYVNTQLRSFLAYEGILTEYDIDDLDAQRSQVEKAFHLIKILHSKRDSYKHLLDALAQTNQTGATNVLQPGLNKSTKNEAEVQKALKDEETEKLLRQAINDNLDELVNLTNCNVAFYAELIAENLMSFGEIDDLNCITRRSERIRQMYLLLLEKDTLYPVLYKILETCGQTGASHILKGGVENGHKKTTTDFVEKHSTTANSSPEANKDEEMMHKGIQENLEQLVSVTVCNSSLFAGLMSMDLLTSSEMDDLEAIVQREERARQLYLTLLSKRNLYPTIIEVFESCFQSGVSKLLRESVQQKENEN